MRAWAQSITAALLVVLVATLATVSTTGDTSGASDAGAVRMVQGTQSPSAAPGDAPARPNLVFVLTDDMRDDDLDHMPITRRLLADQGMEFTDAISPHPLCCPARAQLATGQYAQNNGVQHNRGEHGGFAALDPTEEASVWFRDSGYQTAFVGKFLNGYGPQDVRPAGWTRWDALTRGVYDYVDFSMTGDGDPRRYTDSYVTSVIEDHTNRAVRDFARSGDPFAALRVVHFVSRLRRNETLQLRDVVTALNAEFLDWSFSEKVVLAEIVQLQANWGISFHGDDRIVLDRNERGHTLLITDSTKMTSFLVNEARRLSEALDGPHRVVNHQQAQRGLGVAVHAPNHGLHLGGKQREVDRVLRH